MAKFFVPLGRERQAVLQVMRHISLDLNAVPKGFPSPVCFWLELWWLSTIGLYASSTPPHPHTVEQETQEMIKIKGNSASGEGHVTPLCLSHQKQALA